MVEEVHDESRPYVSTRADPQGEGRGGLSDTRRLLLIGGLFLSDLSDNSTPNLSRVSWYLGPSLYTLDLDMSGCSTTHLFHPNPRPSSPPSHL